MCLACLHSSERKVTRIRSSLRGENKIKKKKANESPPPLPGSLVHSFFVFHFFFNLRDFPKNCNFSSMFVIARSSVPTTIVSDDTSKDIQVYFQDESNGLQTKMLLNLSTSMTPFPLFLFAGNTPISLSLV